MSLYSQGYTIDTPNGTPQAGNRNTPPRYEGITPHDVEVLRSRNIPPHIAASAGIRTITSGEAKDYGHRELSGLLIPSHNTQGDIDRYQLRPHTPPADDKGRPRKYLWPAGCRQSLYVSPASLEVLRDIEAPVIITEAPLKALAIEAALEVEGVDRPVAVIAVAGVYGWRSEGMPLSDHGDVPWRRKEGERIRYRRRVYLAFDSDAETNPNVSRARWEYAQYLTRRGARVRYIDVPAADDGGKQGIDDALAMGCDLGEMITSARPAPDIMPAIDPDAAGDDPALSEVERLRTENASLREHVSTLTRTLTTPHVNTKTKAMITRTATLTRAKAARGEVDQDGRVHLSAAEISNDWRAATPKGEATPATNADGSMPIMKRGTVVSTARKARDEMKILDFTEAKVRKTHANGNDYWDTELVITPPVSIAAALEPVAMYAPAEIAPRPYRRQEPCRECGEVHPRQRRTYCTGCGAESEPPVILPVPPADDPDATPEQREALDRQTATPAPPEITSTKNVEVKDVDISSPSPAPSNYLSTKNVEVNPDTADDTSTNNVEVPRTAPPRPCVDCGERPAASHDRDRCGPCARRVIASTMNAGGWEVAS